MSRAPKQPIMNKKVREIDYSLVRFATPKEVSEYRADRLKTEKLVEIGAGIGSQTIAFSKKCKKVISIEKDKERYEVAKKELANKKSVTVLNSDALSKEIIEIIKKEKPEIIFCDTEREASGERTIENIKPSVKEILETYSPVTENITIEIPPYTKEIEKLKQKPEQEFISLNEKLNRLTLYFGKLKKAEKSVVFLPSKKRITNDDKKIKTSKVKEGYLYIINPAIVLAKLEENIPTEKEVQLIKENKKSFLISSEKLEKELKEFIEEYKILATSENNFLNIINELKRVQASKVLIRYEIDPKEYWNERNKYENKLIGDKEVNLFIFKSINKAIIAKKDD